MRLVIALQPSPAAPLVAAKARTRTARPFTWIPACAGMSGAVALVFAALLIVPPMPASARGTPGLAIHTGVSDLSAAEKKRKMKRKAPKKQEYLRAAPSGPPPGTK